MNVLKWQLIGDIQALYQIMALTREGMKEERAGNTVGKKEREERGEKKESNSINLCMDRWIFF